jgi:broad specificity phosphatase PhoE
MTTRFMLVRHGSCAQTDTHLLGRAIDAPLNERGVGEAEAVAARLVQEHPTRLYASPRLRTRQTATIIAEIAACECDVSEKLDEIEFGRWSGKTFAELAGDPSWRLWNSERSRAHTPLNETIGDVQTRILALLDTLADLHGGETLVLVTHGEIIRCALLHYLGRSPDAFMGLDIAPCSLSRLDLRNGRGIIHSINERPTACVTA